MTELPALRRNFADASRKAASGDLIISSGPSGGTPTSTALALKKGETWSVDVIRALAMEITGDVIAAQEKLNNPVEEILTDGSLYKSPSKMNRSLTSIFNRGQNVRDIMDSLLGSALKRVPNTQWKWRVSAGPDTVLRDLTASVRSGGPVYLNAGDRVYLVPASQSIQGGIDATFRNILFKHGLSSDAAGRFKKTGGRRPLGYYAMTTLDVRAAARRVGVNVRAFHSLRHASDALRRLPSGYSAGSKSNARSQFTNNPKYYQGVWGFALSLSRNRRR